jgi:hypothetical protein
MNSDLGPEIVSRFLKRRSGIPQNEGAHPSRSFAKEPALSLPKGEIQKAAPIAGGLACNIVSNDATVPPPRGTNLKTRVLLSGKREDEQMNTELNSRSPHDQR